MKSGRLVALLLLCAGCASPTIFTADVAASATQSAAVGGQAQLVVMITNTGPAIPHLGLVFMSADKWYAHHTVTDLGGCTISADASAFECVNMKTGKTETKTNDASATIRPLRKRSWVSKFMPEKNKKEPTG